MKKKLTSKKCIAVILAVVMIITSVPLMMVGAEIKPGSYDPAPSFSEDAIKQGADAWLDEDGNIQVKFPAATLGASYAEYKAEIADGVVTDAEKAARDDIPIAFYILEIVDMGAKNAVHQKNVLDTIKVTGTSATFKVADIGEIDLENNRYSVTITAVDSEGWFSQSMYTTVSNLPAIGLDPEKFHYFSTSDTAVREMATFDGETNSDNTATTTGNALLYMGPAAEAGTEDLTDNIGDTSALRFIMNDMPSGTQTFYTSYSRETWDFKGAEEVWYWLDFSNVNIQGLAFNLGAQCKDVTGWADGKNVNVSENEVIQYSTKGTTYDGYTGETPYVYIQREDAGWDKVMMTNGTIDLANFKGYVRIPIKFFCSEKDTYITTTNTEFGTDKSSIVATSPWLWTDTNELVAQTRANGDAYVVTLKSSTQIPVDVAGTPITEALMMQHRYFKCSGCKKALTAYGEDQVWDLGYMPAAAVGADSDDGLYTQTSGEAASKRATVNLSAGTITRNADTYRAIEDLKTMGFSYENCSTDSLQNSFFVDNIFFYRTDGGAYPNNSLVEGETKIGSPMTTYYNEELKISKIIFDEIDKYIENPDWADYREIQHVLDLIEDYRQVFEAKGKSTDFLDLSKVDGDNGDDATGVGLAWAAGILKRDSWAKAWAAYDACLEAGTLSSANADRSELVPLIIRAMEKLPAPENISSVSDALRIEIIKIWKAYALLNIGQLDMLGKAEEEKILKYVALLDGTEKTEDEFVVGQQLADNPYIVFNDFEKYEIGEKAWQLEDNKDAYSPGFQGGTGNLANDWKHTKNFVTFTTKNGAAKITDTEYYGYAVDDASKDEEYLDNKVNYNASWATITNNGYMKSKGANLYVDSAFTASENDGAFHTVTLTKDGNPIGADYSNNMSGINLGGIAQGEYKGGDGDTPLSIVFYVDFTEIENFYFTVNLFSHDNNGRMIKARVNMGLQVTDALKQQHWKYFILDPETGSWVINHTTSQYVFNSNKNETWGDTLGLDGYKGYLMIPLYHIKVKEDEIMGIGYNETKMDENATYLNNIFAVQFAIAGADGKSLDGKNVIFDNVGFTYSDWYSAYSSRNDKSYAENFGAKSIPAKNFENAVAAIDIYDDATRATKVNEALTLYNALPEYQKTKVADAKATLDKYQRIVNGTETLETALYTVDQLNAFVASLPDVIKNSSVSGEDFDIPEPGFTNGSVNYSTMEITPELAQEIISYYKDGYKCFSATQKGEVAEKEGFLNAYNMAMRLSVTLENILGEAKAFLPKLASEYNVKKDSNGNTIGNFVSIADRDDIQNFWDAEYKPLQYYSKTSIDDGSIYPQLKYTSRGLTYFLKNTEQYDLNEDGTIDVYGGILNFKEDMQTAYETAARKIRNKEPFNETELQEIEDLLGEYNAFLPAYYNIEELYQLEQDIIALFAAAADVVVMDAETSGTDISVTGVTLDSDNLEKTIYVDLSYVAARLGRTVTLRAVSDLKLTQESGTPHLNFNSFSAGSLVADTEIDLAEFYNSGTSTNARVPMKISVDPAAAAAVPQGLVYNGSVTFYVYDTDDIDAGLTGEDLVVLDKVTIPVKYISTKGAIPTYYEITFPAAVTVPFGETNAVTSGDITITHTMPSTKKLTISLTETGGAMVIDTTKLPSGVTLPDPLPAINYTATFADKVVIGTGTTGTDKTNFTVQVTEDQWKQAYVNDYIDSGLTFTVACEDVT